MKVEYRKDIENLEDIRDGIFEAIMSGIDVCKQKNLPSFSAEFELFNAHIKMLIVMRECKNN